MFFAVFASFAAKHIIQLPNLGLMIKNHLTFVSASGLKRNANAFDIQSVVTLDDLFKE